MMFFPPQSGMKGIIDAHIVWQTAAPAMNVRVGDSIVADPKWHEKLIFKFLLYYDSTPMQYATIFNCCKNDNF